MTTQNYRNRTLQARIAERTTIDPLSGCHIWEGTRSRGGYPRMSLHGKTHALHRLLWTLRYGPIPAGLELCHRCDERRCINPDHHFVDTHQANMDDMRQKRRARLERAAADAKGLPPPPALDVPEEELTPIRIYVRGVEIVGKAVIRPFDPRGKL
jgi:hypothetical protein